MVALAGGKPASDPVKTGQAGNEERATAARVSKTGAPVTTEHTAGMDDDEEEGKDGLPTVPGVARGAGSGGGTSAVPGGVPTPALANPLEGPAASDPIARVTGDSPLATLRELADALPPADPSGAALGPEEGETSPESVAESGPPVSDASSAPRGDELRLPAGASAAKAVVPGVGEQAPPAPPATLPATAPGARSAEPAGETSRETIRETSSSTPATARATEPADSPGMRRLGISPPGSDSWESELEQTRVSEAVAAEAAEATGQEVRVGATATRALGVPEATPTSGSERVARPRTALGSVESTETGAADAGSLRAPASPRDRGPGGDEQGFEAQPVTAFETGLGAATEHPEGVSRTPSDSKPFAAGSAVSAVSAEAQSVPGGGEAFVLAGTREAGTPTRKQSSGVRDAVSPSGTSAAAAAGGGGGGGLVSAAAVSSASRDPTAPGAADSAQGFLREWVRAALPERKAQLLEKQGAIRWERGW